MHDTPELVPPPKQHEYARAIILGGELNVHDPRNGTTWLHECAKQGWDTTANMLLTHGADANLEDDLGRTACARALEVLHEQTRRLEGSAMARAVFTLSVRPARARPLPPTACARWAMAPP